MAILAPAAGADGQVAGHGEGFRRHERRRSDVTAPAHQKSRHWVAVDPAGVVGEDGRPGRRLLPGRRPAGLTYQGGGFLRDDLRVAGGGGHKRISGGGD